MGAARKASLALCRLGGSSVNSPTTIPEKTTADVGPNLGRSAG